MSKASFLITRFIFLPFPQKISFLLSYVFHIEDSLFVIMQEPTIGAAFFTQILSLSEATVKFDIWDTAGQERYHSLAPMYYRGAAAAVVVYDISSTVPTNQTSCVHIIKALHSWQKSCNYLPGKKKKSFPFLLSWPIISLFTCQCKLCVVYSWNSTTVNCLFLFGCGYWG